MISIRLLPQIINTKDKQKYVEAVIDPHVLRELLNEDGIIIIGEKTYKYTYHSVYDEAKTEIDKLYTANLLALNRQEIKRENYWVFGSLNLIT